MNDCFNSVGLPNDRFMFKTVVDIAQEHGVTEQTIIDKVYEDLYSISDAVNKPWNCKQIDRLIEKYKSLPKICQDCTEHMKGSQTCEIEPWEKCYREVN